MIFDKVHINKIFATIFYLNKWEILLFIKFFDISQR